MKVTLPSGKEVTLVTESCMVVAMQDNLDFTGEVKIVPAGDAQKYADAGHFLYPSFDGFVQDYQQTLAEEAWNDCSDLYDRIADNGRVKHVLDRSPYER